jgi:hypothetical protein
MSKEMLKNIKSNGRSAQGRKEFIAYLNGKSISPEKSILAACYRCRNFYADGKKDCETHECPLYPFMPYTKGRLRMKQERSQQQKKQTLRSVKPDSTAVRS